MHLSAMCDISLWKPTEEGPWVEGHQSHIKQQNPHVWERNRVMRLEKRHLLSEKAMQVEAIVQNNLKSH